MSAQHENSSDYGALTRLTPAQLDCLRLVDHGLTNREIARARCTSARTVKYHLQQSYMKLDVHDRASAAIAAFGGDAHLARCARLSGRHARTHQARAARALRARDWTWARIARSLGYASAGNACRAVGNLRPDANGAPA